MDNSLPAAYPAAPPISPATLSAAPPMPPATVLRPLHALPAVLPTRPPTAAPPLIIALSDI